MTHPFWLHVNDLVVLEINVKIFMEYHLLLKWLLQMLNVKSYGLPDCAWSNVWTHCEPWQITYIVKNPYFFMQPELETYPFSYVLHEPRRRSVVVTFRPSKLATRDRNYCESRLWSYKYSVCGIQHYMLEHKCCCCTV